MRNNEGIAKFTQQLYRNETSNILRGSNRKFKPNGILNQFDF